MPNAVVLLSGGLDSTTTLAIAKGKGYEPYALEFRYGQRHDVEIEAARRIAEALGAARHVVAEIDLRVFGGSALTADIEVPKGRAVDEMADEIPVTYVPARNTIFLSFALAWAETLEANDIFIGVNALDYSGYPDCRPEYIAAFQEMANLATKAGVEGRQRLTIHTPLIALTKRQIIERGLALGIDYGMTISCYDPTPSGEACGECDACLFRRKGFLDLGVADPTRYQPKASVDVPYVLSPEEGKAFFDRQARYVTGMSGDEFIAKWDAGEYRDQDLDATQEGRTIVSLAALIPFARQGD